jgi:hypothetical protein
MRPMEEIDRSVEQAPPRRRRPPGGRQWCRSRQTRSGNIKGLSPILLPPLFLQSNRAILNRIIRFHKSKIFADSFFFRRLLILSAA